MKFSYNDQYLIAGCSTGIVLVFKFPSLELKSELIEHKKSVQEIVLTSYSNQEIISGSHDGTLIIWDLETGRLKKKLKGHSNAIMSLALSNYPLFLVSGDKSGDIKIWKDYSLLRTIRIKDEIIYGSAISRDGRIIISGTLERLVIWGFEGAAIEFEIRERCNCLSLTIDDRYLIFGDSDGRVHIYEDRVLIKKDKKDRISKLKKILKVSTEITVERLAHVLDINLEFLWENIWDWANDLGFKIKNDVIIIQDLIAEELLLKLDKAFEDWNTKNSKKE